ncbi:MAG: AAA family ATPase [Deltaproteobacteria bacterium]|nr:AAA family ATPase [Deltaproteobacteria bacterium]
MNLAKYSPKSQATLVESQKVARGRQHQAIEPEHLLAALLVDELGRAVLERVGLKISDVQQKLEVELVKLPKVAGASNYLSPRFLKVSAAAEVTATKLGAKVDASHLLSALADPSNNSGAPGRLLRDHGASKDRIEQSLKVSTTTKGGTVTDAGPADASALGKYAIDLVQKAKDGKLDPIIGRDDEMRRIIQVLSRRSKNNPVLIGKPGVGKNAIIQGLAHRIAIGDVPSTLKDKRLLALDLGSLLAGASLRGQFEERIKSIITEVKASDGDVILFIDEIHTLVGAGGEGASDASQMLKPPLARGEIQVLGATTPDEYRNSIEKDKALERRFQSILVEEMGFDETLRVLRGVKSRYEVHHGVRIQDPALVAAIKFAQRYVQGRQLPDKAIDLIDEAASRLRVAIDSVPDVLDIEDRTLTQLKMERKALSAENDRDSVEYKQKLEKSIEASTQKVAELRSRWEKEVSLIQAIRAIKEGVVEAEKQLSDAERGGDVDRASELKYGQLKRLEADLQEKTNELSIAQMKGRLIKEEVEPQEVAAVVGDITGVPVSNMLESEREKLMQMEQRIGERVIGQREALFAIGKAIRRSRAGLNDPNRPVGSFFFLGPTGVGKTELAKALTMFLFDDEKAMVRLDMSEFQEKHTVARLLGAPPGYKGADEGGQLTEAVRLKPYSVVLFDEVEKGHPDIFNIMLQVLDDGRLTDSSARLVDFKNTVIIMTSNVGSHHLLEASLEDGVIEPAAKELAFGELKKTFRPEFLGRIDDVIMFHGLTRENIEVIADIQIKKVQGLLKNRRLKMEIDPAARTAIIDAGYEPRFGARPLRRAIQRWLQDPLSMAILEGDYVDDDVIVVALKDPAHPDQGLSFRKKGSPLPALPAPTPSAELPATTTATTATKPGDAGAGI